MSGSRSFWRGTCAVVTGASSGIGAALSQHLAVAGARLTLTGRDGDRLERVAANCRAKGAETVTVAGDLTDDTVRVRLIEAALERFGGLDLLVNNAGVTMNARFDSLAPAVLRSIMDVNFFAAAELTRLALPSLRERHGRILVLSSVTGLVGTPTRTAYAASKHALHGLFDALRVELRGDRVGVTLVCPGYVATPMRINALRGDGSRQEFDQAEGRRMLSPEVVARASLEACRRRKRLLLLGPETGVARVLSFVAPGLLEAVMARVTK